MHCILPLVNSAVSSCIFHNTNSWVGFGFSLADSGLKHNCSYFLKEHAEICVRHPLVNRFMFTRRGPLIREHSHLPLLTALVVKNNISWCLTVDKLFCGSFFVELDSLARMNHSHSFSSLQMLFKLCLFLPLVKNFVVRLQILLT